MSQLLLHAAIKCWTILQGPLGQPFAKPTCLLTARLEGLGAALYAGYDKSWRPTMQLGGRDSDGRTWKTSQAKAYPPKMCKIIVEEHVRFAEAQEGEGIEEEPIGLAERLRILSHAFDPYKQDAQGTTMCADYFIAPITLAK